MYLDGKKLKQRHSFSTCVARYVGLTVRQSQKGKTCGCSLGVGVGVQ